MTDERLEKMLTQALNTTIEDDETSVNLEKRKEPEIYMKSRKTKRIVLIAACMCLLLGTTAFAGAKIKYLESHSRNDEYTTFVEVGKAQNDAGYDVDIIENFSNGYTFDSASVAHTDGKDENDNAVVSFKEFGASYKNADGNTIFLSTTNTADYNESGENDPEPDETRDISGVNVNYTVYRQLLNVPEDAELTDEEKALDEAGKLWMSYDGGTEIEKYNISVVTWEKDGIKYSLFDHHAVESADSLFSMAQEIIEK